MEHFLPGSPVVFLLAWFGWRIAAKAGYSGFWGLTALIPPLGLVALWLLAMTRGWPDKPVSRDDKVSKKPSSIAIRRPSIPVERSRS